MPITVEREETNDEGYFVNKIATASSIPRDRRLDQNFVVVHGEVTDNGRSYTFTASFYESANGYKRKDLTYKGVYTKDVDDKEPFSPRNYRDNSLNSLLARLKESNTHLVADVDLDAGSLVVESSFMTHAPKKK